MMLMTVHRLWVLVAVGFLGVGSFALLHPEFARGGGLVLLGLAALERGSRRTRRIFHFLSDVLGGKPPWRRPRRRQPDRPVAARPRPGWQPVM
jgi:hypothetical protein